MRRVFCVLLILSLLISVSGCGSEAAETTAPETTEPTVPAQTTPQVRGAAVLARVAAEFPTEPAPDESWFDDALFIGESRTMGLKLHGRLGTADYFCCEGLTVYGVLGIQASDTGFSEQTLNSLFSRKQYGKIYIHLGINELGGNLNTFVKQYQSVIDRIRQAQPDACIILQSVLALGKNYSSKPAFSRESIQDINNRIRTLAEKNGLHFSDVNQILTDAEGYLLKDQTFDGCHLYAAGYALWSQWLLEEAASIDISKSE